MTLDLARLEARLEAVEVPFLGMDVVAAGLVRSLSLEGGRVHLCLALPCHAWRGQAALVEACQEELGDLDGVEVVDVETRVEVPAYRPSLARPVPSPIGGDPWAQQGPIGEVRNVVAIASGKGGVGKSTTAVNLAAALARDGARVGLMDADIYGPSGPMMTGLAGKPRLVDEKLVPLEAHGLKVMSMGFLSGEEEAMVWRGPMVQQVVRQFLQDVAWGPLDYLVVDMPPGTGDAQLTLVQTVPLTGAVIVSTPQDVALIDARKGITMFRKVQVEILGLIENMSFFTCTDCGARHEIFASGGTQAEAERQGVPFLGGIPLVPAVRVAADEGHPVVLSEPESPVARAYTEAARLLAERVALHALRDPRRSLRV